MTGLVWCLSTWLYYHLFWVGMRHDRAHPVEFYELPCGCCMVVNDSDIGDEVHLIHTCGKRSA